MSTLKDISELRKSFETAPDIETKEIIIKYTKENYPERIFKRNISVITLLYYSQFAWKHLLENL